MIRFSILMIVFVALAGCIACGKPAATDTSNVNSGPQPVQYTDANTALSEGNRLLDSNQTELAIDAFKQATVMNPDLGEPYFKLGIAYSLLEAEEKGKLSTAPVLPGEQTNKAGQAKPESQKAFEKAVEVYKKWVSANPQDDAAYFNLGRAYNKLNQDDEAEKAFRQAVKLKDDDTEYQTELGGILIKLARYREAIDPLKKALDLDPDNSQAADLLEDAEAGRTRIDFVPVKKDDSNRSSNSNSSSNSSPSSNSNGSQTPAGTPERPLPTPEKKETKDTRSTPATKPPSKPSGDAKQHT